MSDPLFYDNDSPPKGSLTQRIKSLNPYILSALSVVMLLVIAFSLYAFYPSEKIDPLSLPVIQASNESVRVKPEDTKITETSEYDSRIYETFGQSGQSKKIENLLQPRNNTEEPLPREQLFAGLNQQSENTQGKSKVISITESPFNADNEGNISESVILQEQQTDAPTNNTAEIQTPDQEKLAPAPGIFENKQDEKVANEDVTVPLENTEPAAGPLTNVPSEMPVAKTTELPKGDFYVQLASIQESAKTSDAWKKLTEKHRGLTNVSYRTQNATIPGKGAFYRIQAGPLSKEAAEKLCNEIKGQSGSCFVTSK